MGVEDSLRTKVQDLVDRAEIVDCLNRWSVKNADARCRASSLVRSELITSTSRSTGTGLKKCNPMSC